MESQTKDGNTYSTVECEIEFHRPSNLWFPSRVKFEKPPRGGIGYREELTVKTIQLIEKISPEVFAVSGIGVRPGKSVVTIPRDPRGELIWNGKEIVPITFSLPVPPQAEVSNSRRWFFVASLILAVFASLAVWKYLKSRRRHPLGRE